MPSTQIACPKCGGSMNHHADKVDYVATLEEPEGADRALDGVLEEIHQCLNAACGWIEARRAPTT